MRTRGSLLFPLVLLIGAGCSMSAADSNSLSGNGASGGSAGSSNGPASELPTSLAFQDGPTTLGPRKELTLTVQALPAARYLVRFALPSDSRYDPLDAVLDRSETETDDDGLAQVVVLGPSTSGSFQVRATVGGTVAATRELSVSDEGFATVQVEPAPIGHRMPTAWVASARPKETCADSRSVPAVDGPYVGFAPADKAPTITDVPAGVPVAITLRSGHFMGGCASVEMLPAGPVDRPQIVHVTVLDRPIDLAASNVSLSLSLAAGDTAFGQTTTEAQGAITIALLGTSTDDADALLDAMRNLLTGQPRLDLDTARKNEGWDALLRAHWGSGAATRLRDTVSPWLSQAAAALVEQSMLDGLLSAVDAKSAELTLDQVAGITADEAGFVTPAFVTWRAYPDDTVELGTDLYFSTSRLVTGLAGPVALLQVPEADTASAALALELDCAGVASVLASAGADLDLAYAACDSACLSELCTRATAAIWKRGRESTTSQPAHLRVSATGPARVGDGAQIAGIKGSWVGELDLQGDTKTTGGPLIVAEPAEK